MRNWRKGAPASDQRAATISSSAALSALAVILVGGGCSAPLPVTEDIEARESPIVGGVPTPVCAWPTTVSYSQSGAGCTATLVHPKVITVADHCVSGNGGTVSFTDAIGAKGARTVSIQKCYSKDINQGEDFAVCVLAQEVTDIPIIPVLFGCETSILKPGQEVALVGYGFIDENTQSPGEHKRWVTAKINRINSGMKSVDIGDPMHQNCFGDSGGPAFVKLADGSWRVFGVTSTTNSPACASQGTWALTPTYVAWAEQQTGLDLTPCHNAATGAWEGGPTCQGFPLNPEVALGTWANGCTENLMRSGPITSCGGGTDAGAPVRDAQAEVGVTGVGGTGGTGGGRDAGRAGGGQGGTGGSGGAGGNATGGGRGGATTGGGNGGATGGAGGFGTAGGSGGGSAGRGNGGGGATTSTTTSNTTTGTTTTTTGSGGSTSGSGSAGSGPGSTGGGGAGKPTPRVPPTTDPEGCACRFGASPSHERATPFALLLFAGLLGHGRRRRRSSS